MGLMRIDLHEDVPLWVDEEHGVIRIPGTRLKLETVIHMYYEGCTEPEEIVQSFDTLTVEAVERILDWYQTRREEVDVYMEWTEREEDRIRTQYEPRIAQSISRRRREVRQAQPQSI